MRAECAAGLTLVCMVALAACGEAPTSGDPQPGSAGAPQGAVTGGGLVAEPSDVAGTLTINIRWTATVVTGIPEEGQTTTVYDRTTQLLCPVTSNGEASYSYFTFIDKPDGNDPFAATGSYQQWLNEECSGTLKVDDTYHADDPTLAGPEPIVRTTGTQSLSTADIPITVETDLDRGRTRYLFLPAGAGGFQQQAAPGYPAKLVAASAAPVNMDFTVEGPIGGGKGEVAVQGGVVHVDWTFTRGGQQR